MSYILTLNGNLAQRSFNSKSFSFCVIVLKLKWFNILKKTPSNYIFIIVFVPMVLITICIIAPNICFYPMMLSSYQISACMFWCSCLPVYCWILCHNYSLTNLISTCWGLFSKVTSGKYQLWIRLAGLVSLLGFGLTPQEFSLRNTGSSSYIHNEPSASLAIQSFIITTILYIPQSNPWNSHRKHLSFLRLGKTIYDFFYQQHNYV